MGIIVENVSFKSEGVFLSGRIYRQNDAGVYPAVAICLGYPGDTKHTDLAEELALNGIVSLVFFYRGAWWSEGRFSFLALEPSTRDAIEFLLSQRFVDPERVGLIGHSMGAIPLSKRLSTDPRLKTGIFISPVADICGWAFEVALDSIIPRFLGMAEGKLRGLTAEIIKSELPKVARSLNPVDTIKDVKAPVMFIVGSNDSVTPPEMCKVLYDAANSPKRWRVMEGADHTFSQHRVLLINEILNWLKETL